MVNNDELALKTRKEFEAYYNETHALKATSQFKRFGYYVSPTMQKAWELWQAAQSSLLAERDADKKRIDKLSNERAKGVETLQGELIQARIRADAAEKRIAELEARTVSVKLPDSDEYLGKYGDHMSDMASYENAVYKALAAAGIKLEVGE